jgi:hypothetical protein
MVCLLLDLTWVHAKTPPPDDRAECAHHQSLHGCMDVRTKTTDAAAMLDAMATYAGTVTRCPPGRARAPDEKRYGQAQFKCTCGHAGTMPYPKLFKRLRRGRRQRKPLRLRCERCGRVLP